MAKWAFNWQNDREEHSVQSWTIKVDIKKVKKKSNQNKYSFKHFEIQVVKISLHVLYSGSQPKVIFGGELSALSLSKITWFSTISPSNFGQNLFFINLINFSSSSK